ncbi:hypothetical protein CIC12_28910 [Burkholderia sp. SG-MS1]|uniref:porin n=1 Tax=Paraburkholderia sp. SG-MS1 TaxID=2023741 RepID=UPI001446E6E1|nr:porin [Paraburkholderia sp. SG-MS1]NKJ50674.1 hypothetical protein [Paraburkholderia sp. SG-MS1]
MKLIKIVLLSVWAMVSGTVAGAQESQMQDVFGAISHGAGPAAFGVVSGSSLMSIYGTVDAGVNYTRSGGQGTLRLQSGDDFTSKFGFYGQEDLGARWTSFFRLESGFYSNSGALQSSSTLFNRAAILGLQNPQYGQIMLGRQYTSLALAALMADPFLGVAHDSVFSYMIGVSDLGTGASNDTMARLNNTIRYSSPRFAKYFVFDASYSLKSDQTVGPATEARTGTLSYNDGATFVEGAFGQNWCDPSVSGSCTGSSGIAPSKRTDTYMINVIRDFGPFIGSAAYIRFVPQNDGTAIANLYMLSVQKMRGNDLFRALIAYRRTSVDGDWSYGTTLGINHFLSKRTSVYARAGFLHNGPHSSLTYNYDNGVPVAAVGETIMSVTLGMIHNF